MDNNDLTFFTNEPERNLYDRFKKILNKNTRFFDVLVGYFRASGFHLMQEALEKVEKTRILIGINTDKNILEMYEESQGNLVDISLSNKEAIEQYEENLKKEFENCDDNKEVENGVNKFVELIKNGKLEIRMYTQQPIHAKIYIMKDYEDSPDYGRVITGSSNFSKSGLVNNLEFNVELKNQGDVKFAENKFEELWRLSVPINQECVDTIETKTWIKSDITPYELYVKFLYEYFKEEINDDLIDYSKDRYYPDNFKPLQYQKDAVIQAKKMIEKHNGVFISDVVGLGKTYICAMLAKELESGILIICPPMLVEYWKKVMFEFGVRRYKVESAGKLEKLSKENINIYKYVFVDESHRFRNADTEQYKLLHQICVGKKVVLISATPQNNYSTDIENQLYLFESKNKSTIVGARNLELFFDNLRKNLKQYEPDTDNYREELKKVSEEIRDKVLRNVMIRRTRTEIKKTYGEDLRRQNIKFPKVSDPEKMIYQFSPETEKVFEKTIEKISDLNYSRYKPLTYVKSDKLTANQKTLLTGQSNMSGFMKGILVKRLESSKFAFTQTLGRFIESYNKYIKMYEEQGVIWISKKINADDLLANGDYDILEKALESEEAMKFKKEDFNNNFIKDLKSDIAILVNLKEIWDSLESDDKLEYFIKELKENKLLMKNKLIIFTESKETADYLTENIKNKIGQKVIKFSGSMSDSIRDVIKENFDPNNYIKANDYRILVTTDVLAEGMNLHRSNVIINYDLPWNPTRIMQRVGRINRVGTKFNEIHVFNFFPTSKSNEQISLEQNIISKIQMFHDIFGEDSKFLTEDEHVSTHELFRKMTKINDEDDGTISSELSYLKVIRDIRDNDIELFNKIKNYPKKIKIGRRKDKKEGLVTFFRKGYLKRFYLANKDNIEEITFEEAIDLVKATKSENAKKVNQEYYDLLIENKKAFEESEKEDNLNESITSINKRGTSNVKQIIGILEICLKNGNTLTDEEEKNIEKIIELLKNGDLPKKIVKDANKKIKLLTSPNEFINFYKEFENSIPKVYIETKTIEETQKQNEKKLNREIILSEQIF